MRLYTYCYRIIHTVHTYKVCTYVHMYISLLCLTLFEAIHIYYTYPCDMCTYLFIIFDIVLEQPKPQHLPVPPAWQPGRHSLASFHRPRRRCTASSGRSKLRRRRRSAKGE